MRHQPVEKEAVTNDVISNARISAQRDGFPAVDVPVDLNGDFVQQLKEGHYKIIFSAVGYVDQVFELDLKLTGLKILNIELVKEA